LGGNLKDDDRDFKDISLNDFDPDDILEKTEIPIDEHKRILKTLTEEIVRKDDMIGYLQERNDILVNTTINQASKITELLERIKKLNSEVLDTRDELKDNKK
jgi:polyhydroxyalkanoate synthesis regulator phasin